MEWVVIKGISDYADGSKSETKAWRPFASVMAASVVENILKVPGLLKDWLHYKGVNHKHEGKLHIILLCTLFPSPIRLCPYKYLLCKLFACNACWDLMLSRVAMLNKQMLC